MMNNEVILQVKNVSKQYRLGTIGTGTISHDLNRWWYKIRGKQDPFLKIGESNDRSAKGTSDYVWALKEVTFDVNRGEVLGIIGKNGAGKSTLLKILSKVTGPTEGNIKSKGKIASLLEVGTGFHPEMTGRENIFLNGAILGMTKKEIRTKLDEIISFSGCERYIDTPVKRYSSGMKVRLAFAVAAHLEPDILVVDEVLAVGDAEFQKKAIGKMQDISNSEGRTVLFVSHDMGAIQNLCNRLIVLKNGTISYDGPVEKGINSYLSSGNETQEVLLENDVLKILDISFYKEDRKTGVFKVFEPIVLKCSLRLKNDVLPEDMKIEFFVQDFFGQRLTTLSSWLNSVSFKPESKTINIEVKIAKGFSINTGEYSLDMNVVIGETHFFENILNFELISNAEIGYKYPLKPGVHGKIFTPNHWGFKNLKDE